VSWVEVADLSTARRFIAPAGDLTAALAAGGKNGSTTASSEEWSNTTNTTKTISTD